MNKLLLAICLTVSILAYAEQSATVGNLTIKMSDKNNDWLKIYKDDKIVLDESCSFVCDILSVKSDSFEFKIYDGLVIADEKTAFNLHPDNIVVFKTGWLSQNDVVGFVVSSGGANGLYGSQTIYTIDIDSGDVSKESQEFDNNLSFID